MRVGILAATGNGRRHAEHLAEALRSAVLPGAPVASELDVRVLAAADGARAALEGAWGEHDAFVLCMATGAAVRLIAPLLDEKHTDPAVVTVDDAARFAVALAGGHHGANSLAGLIARALGAEPVVTTASEVLDLPALDELGSAFGLRLDPAIADVAAVGSALAAGAFVTRWREAPWPTGPLPGNVTDVDTVRDAAGPAILVTDRLLGDPPRPAVCYRPPSLFVGVGGSRGVPAEEVTDLITTALLEAGMSPLAVDHVATVDAKAHEAGILEAAATQGWEVRAYPADALEQIEVPNPSEVVRDAVGTASVAEAAALLAAGDGAELVVPKRASRRDDGAPSMATVAIARRPARGRLALVSTGPGDPDLLPDMARRELGQAEIVVGLDQYIDRIRPWLRPGCDVHATPIGDEVARARDAVASARAGRATVLVSGGDIGVYAMGSPALEVLGDDRSVDVVVVPGVTAAVAAAALLGSPLGHDHCAISLSDLLTPWEVIRRRVKAAAEGDFVVTFYNPRSRGRDWQLGEARLLLLEHRKPDTPVGIVTEASRPTQRVVVTTLGELDVDQVDMLTCVVVGNTQTRIEGGRIVTPRGYA